MAPEPRLRLAPRFTHMVSTETEVILVDDDEPVLVENDVVRKVLRNLDGTRTATDLARLLGDRSPPEHVHFAILGLMDTGIVVEVRPGGPPAKGLGGLAGTLSRLWGEDRDGAVVDVPASAWSGPGGCRLRLVDDYLRPEAGHGLDDDGAVLLASPGARRAWLGPVLSGEGACVACLQARLRLNLVGRSLVHLGSRPDGDVTGIVHLPSIPPESTWRALAGELPTGAEGLERLTTVLRAIPADAPGSTTSDHHVPRLPQCPVCGDGRDSTPGADVSLRPRPWSRSSGGGYRIVEPDETLARYDHLVSPWTGVVRRIRPVPVDGTELLHVYSASHAHHYGPGSIRALRDDRRDHSGGKGRTDVDARASALCESLERFSSVFRGDEPRRTARLSELGDEALAPNQLMQFSARQFRERESWNRRQVGGFQMVPRPYADEAIGWSEVRSLASGSVRLVPSAFLYHGFDGPGDPFCDGDSNGLAGGNCLEEAILQGFLEVVERDAIALWWYNRVRRPGVDLAASGDDWIEGLLAYYDTLARDVWVLDLTADLHIPTFAALSSLRTDTKQDIIFGFGAHLDAGIALTRAFTELNQMLPTVLQDRETRRRRLLPDFTDAVRWWDEATVASEPYLLPHPELPETAVRASTGPGQGDLLDDVHLCVERAASVGCDVLVHDLTRPDVGFPVAKVLVPGMRHFWRRLGPGRLYDVPVALGWQAAQVPEEEMNPVSVFV